VDLRENKKSYDCIVASNEVHKEDHFMFTYKYGESLDQEWITLIKSALEQGLTPEEIRIFLTDRQK